MHLVRGNIISIPACVHLKSACDKRSLLVAVPSPPPRPRVKRRRGNVYANLTLTVFRDNTLLQENI